MHILYVGIIALIVYFCWSWYTNSTCGLVAAAVDVDIVVPFTDVSDSNNHCGACFVNRKSENIKMYGAALSKLSHALKVY